MKQLARLIIICLIAALPVQAMAGISMVNCDMAQMGHSMNAGHDMPTGHGCCPDQDGTDSKGGKHGAGCSHCLACFAAGSALLSQAVPAIQPAVDTYQTARALPLDSQFIEPPIHPPQSFLA